MPRFSSIRAAFYFLFENDYSFEYHVFSAGDFYFVVHDSSIQKFYDSEGPFYDDIKEVI